MGFAAVARVTEDYWVTCKAKDLINFGLKPGDELPIQTTICNEIRQHQKPVIIDHVSDDSFWCTHHTPLQYGFESYISIPIFRKDGRFFGTLCAIDPKPARVSNSEVRDMFLLFADLISFHLEAFTDLEEANAMLEEERQMAALRDTFIAILGHDLQNPVFSIRMSAEMLLEETLSELAKEHGETIKASSIRMQRLISNLLDFARGRLGDGIILALSEDMENLQSRLLQVTSELKSLFPNIDVHLNFSLDQPLACDVERIGQLYSNLLGNALKHGDPAKEVKVDVLSTTQGFTLRIGNSGVPINPQHLPHLFKPFFRDKSNKNNKGLGLGLYISQEIAKAHGGAIKVRSDDKITEFELHIPANSKN